MPPLRSLTDLNRSGDSKICSIHQPHYMPWGRYLHKIAVSDVFVFLDDAQYNKNGWQNRNRLKGPNGAYTITVPVHHAYQQSFIDTKIADRRWARRHLQAIRSSYGRSTGLEDAYDRIEALLSREWHDLVELNIACVSMLMEVIGIETPCLRSSEIPTRGAASDRLAEICAAVDATHYLTGAHAARTYLSPTPFSARGIGLKYQLWYPPTYAQTHDRVGFVPDLSVIDLIAAAGEAAHSLLLASGRVVDSMSDVD